MTVIKRQFVLATGFLSGIAAIISCVSLGTGYWVTSKVLEDNNVNTVRYGLFSGIYRQNYPTDSTFEILMTCAFDKNVCALLCGTEDIRSQVIDDLANNRNASFDFTSCNSIARSAYEHRKRIYRPSANGEKDHRFINAGVWVSSIVFLCASILMGFVSVVIAVWNTASNPIQFLFSLFGLYIYNAIAFCCVLMTIILWGALFADKIILNVAILGTLEGEQTSRNRAELGYSYWILMVSLFLYCFSLATLYARQYLISKEPTAPDVHLEDNADPGLYLY